jgi:hypothetical protein
MFSNLLLKMELNVTMATSDLNIEFIELQQMLFINNAIDAGWAVKKRDNKYIFSKKHENKKEVYLETYLQQFIETNLAAIKKTTGKVVS